MSLQRGSSALQHPSMAGIRGRQLLRACALNSENLLDIHLLLKCTETKKEKRMITQHNDGRI